MMKTFFSKVSPLFRPVILKNVGLKNNTTAIFNQASLLEVDLPCVRKVSPQFFSTTIRKEKRRLSEYQRYGGISKGNAEDYLKVPNQDGSQSNLASSEIGSSLFPTLETHDQSFNGIRYLDIPIVHVTATSNNTKVTLCAGDGTCLAHHTAGSCGFLHAKKGTNVAAQAAAIALAKDAIRQDVKAVRVCLRGIGQGRLPALKALHMTGLEVVSITDTTRLAHNGNRPKKVRRL